MAYNTNFVAEVGRETCHKSNQWDLVLFLEPEGTVFVQDGTRNEDIMKERKKYSNMLKAWFDIVNISLHFFLKDV